VKEPSHLHDDESHVDYLPVLYGRHFQGALVRSGASVIMWLFALACFLTNIINMGQFRGITLSVVYLILINPPTLLLLKHITRIHLYRYASLLINFLEVLGYTAIIYFLGGIESINLTLIYAALITYVGAMSPWSFPYIIAIMCSAAFSFLLAGEYFSFLPPYSTMHHFDFLWITKLAILSIVTGLLFVVAYVSSLTAGTLKKNRNKLREKNLELTEKARILKEAEDELRIAHQELETRVEKRTLELARANEDLESELAARKQAEGALRESEEKYRNILENMAEGYYELDLAGNITFFNEACRMIYGYSREELMGRNALKLADKVNAKKAFKYFNEVYTSGNTLKWIDGEMISKDGSKKKVEGSASLIRNLAGQPIGFRGIIRDVTEHRQSEEEKRKLEERLQRSEKMEALGTLAGGVAHDLNNALGVLVGYSELLLQKVPEDSPFQRHAMQIFRGGQRAAAIIQDLLTLTRRGVLVPESLNLNSVISDFLQVPEFETIKSHHPGVQFKTSLDAELLNIKGSSTHLNKTVMNLLSNAAEAISETGEVLIRTENRYVERPIHGYDTTQEGEYAVLTISDTGSGISPADLGKIFEPFYTKKVMGRSGTGLGLAVVWGTVKDHDGYIDVQSTEGEGSTFTLYFPVTREDLTKAEQVVPQSTYMGRGEHILVVDDVEGQRLLASAMLDSLGYKVNSVASGEEAIEFVKKQPVDLLILDMIMDPGMDGLDTFRSILAIRPKQKAIIVSGFSETDRVHTAQALGAGAYIRKPYVIEKLGLAVKNELDRK